MSPKKWQPLIPEQVARLFSGVGFPWWVAGGWAIDLFLGRQTRQHHDIDIGILRRDQHLAQETLSAWELWAADPPGALRRWDADEPLRFGVHDIWCRETPDAPWRMQLMLNEASGDEWVYRRDASVSRRLDDVVFVTDQGIPYLAPEVQLLFKAKHRGAHDDLDFASALPHLGRSRREWLATQVRRLHPGHPWLTDL